ncbi:MAG: hypothetical protein J2P21_30195 [Chloracidobacterium sp.]|nr:hypothetical protein [Chloracidobacterium sp.]
MMGEEAGRQTFAHDEAGNKSEEVNYSEDGKFWSKVVFEREYDKHGNWTKELISTGWDAEFEPSTPAQVNRRIIKYW